MKKAHLTQLVSLTLLLLGVFFKHDVLLMVGLFSLSGSLTNWLAVHMLFEKIPGLYGSGIIALRFEDFKTSLHELMMQQFFNQAQIDQFLNQQEKKALNLAPVIEKTDLSPAYDKLVETIMSSSFNTVLSMFGGEKALSSLKEPFLENLKQGLIEITQSEAFHQTVQAYVDQPENLEDIKKTIDQIVQKRLHELTPEQVKRLIKQLIAEHLGWLVVWGGFFGGLMGLVSAFFL